MYLQLFYKPTLFKNKKWRQCLKYKTNHHTCKKILLSFQGTDNSNLLQDFQGIQKEETCNSLCEAGANLVTKLDMTQMVQEGKLTVSYLNVGAKSQTKY